MIRRQLGATRLSVPALGFGASPLGGVFKDVDEAEGTRAVHAAIGLGINFFDVSPFYGRTRAEAALGRALLDVPRDRYILATKVGRYGQAEFDFSAARVTQSIDESLQRLHVDHVDLLQCHDIEFGDLNQIANETLPALRRAVQAGKARFVGITGLPLNIFPAVIERATVDVVLSYCHYALNDSSLEALLPDLNHRGIGVINAAPLSMGLLTQNGPPAWHPASGEIKARCAAAAEFCRSKGTDLARLAVQFAVANPAIASTLVGISSVEEMTRNARWAAETPDKALLAEVLTILAPIHNHSWPSGRPENN